MSLYKCRFDSFCSCKDRATVRHRPYPKKKMARFALHPFSLGHRLPKDNVELIPIVSEGNPGEFGVGFFGVTPALFVLVRFFLCWRKRKSGREICVSSLLSGLCLWFFSTDLRRFLKPKCFTLFALYLTASLTVRTFQELSKLFLTIAAELWYICSLVRHAELRPGN